MNTSSHVTRVREQANSTWHGNGMIDIDNTWEGTGLLNGRGFESFTCKTSTCEQRCDDIFADQVSHISIYIYIYVNKIPTLFTEHNSSIKYVNTYIYIYIYIYIYYIILYYILYIIYVYVK